MAKPTHARPGVPPLTFSGPQPDEIPPPLQQGHQQSGEEQAERSGAGVRRRHSPLMIWRGVDRERCASTATVTTSAPGSFVQGPMLSAPPLSARRAVQSPGRRHAVVQHRSLSPNRQKESTTTLQGPASVLTRQASIPVHDAPSYTTARQPPSSPMVTPRSPVLLPRSPVVAPRSPAVAPRSPMLSNRSTIGALAAANTATTKPHPGTQSPSTPRSRRHPQRLVSAPSPPCKLQEQQACALALQDIPSPQRQGAALKLLANVELPSRSPPTRQQSLAEIVASAPMPHQQDVLLSSNSPQRRKCASEALSVRPQPSQLHDSTRGPIRQTSVPDGASALPINPRTTLARPSTDVATEVTPASGETLTAAATASVPRVVAEFSSATTATSRLLRSEASCSRPGGMLLASATAVGSSVDCPLLPPPPGLSHLLGAPDRWPLGPLSNPAAGKHQGIGGTSSSSASRSLEVWGQVSALALPRMPSAPQSGSRGSGLSTVVAAATAPAASPREKLCSSTAKLLQREACGDAAAALLQEGCSSAADARPVPEGRGEWQLGGGREANAGPDRRRFLV